MIDDLHGLNISFSIKAACSNVIILKTCQEVFSHFACDVIFCSSTAAVQCSSAGNSHVEHARAGDYMNLQLWQLRKGLMDFFSIR